LFFVNTSRDLILEILLENMQRLGTVFTFWLIHPFLLTLMLTTFAIYMSDLVFLATDTQPSRIRLVFASHMLGPCTIEVSSAGRTSMGLSQSHNSSCHTINSFIYLSSLQAFSYLLGKSFYLISTVRVLSRILYHLAELVLPHRPYILDWIYI